MPCDLRVRAACLPLCLWVALALLGLFGAALRPDPALAGTRVVVQQASPSPTAAPTEGPPARQRDMTGPAVALACLIVLNAIGLGVMVGLSSRMQAIAEEALQNKRRKR